MLVSRKLAKNEVFDLFHKPLKDGGYKVVRAILRDKTEAIKRMYFLQKKALTYNASLDEFQSIVKIGVEGILEGSLTVNLMTPEKLLNIRFWDCIREFILIGILFKVFEENQIDNSLKLIQ